ncbi:MAG: Zn-dependent exopeptidase M28 [Treponema sp.]|nr:Zn-dependent exopeptidase M28 [Treponema sp.]
MTIPPWKRFREFIAPNADRFSILKELVEEANLEYSIVSIADNRHFFIAPPPPEQEFLRSRLTILTAHYDRSPGSPGANDNSAAVFILIETAAKMTKDKINNWLIIFTDKEELENGESIQDQGAYALAAGLKNSGLGNSRVYNFDACGTGDTIIVSTTAEYLLKKDISPGSEKILASVMELKENALEAAHHLGMDRVKLAPTPFSDDAGFLRMGIAAQTITVLPSNEYMLFVPIVRKNPEFAKILISQRYRNANNLKLIPETWRCLNTARDSYLRLTPEHFRSVQRFAEALCKG